MRGVNFDITDRKQAGEEMERALAASRRINEELSQYAYAVTHDLKAPLRAVRNYADFLYEDLADSLTGEQKQYLTGMKKALAQGDKLIDDLLCFLRLGHLTPQAETVDVAELVHEISSLLAFPPNAEIHLQSHFPAINTDHSLLKQVLQNLIANAVKFNRSNPKRIEIGWQAEDDRIEILVRDNGLGIQPQYHQQIFRIFQRLHTDREYEGTGIGLAIVQKAVQKLGGTLRLESVPGEGSTFYVRLPPRQLTAQTSQEEGGHSPQ